MSQLVIFWSDYLHTVIFRFCCCCCSHFTIFLNDRWSLVKSGLSRKGVLTCAVEQRHIKVADGSELWLTSLFKKPCRRKPPVIRSLSPGSPRIIPISSLFLIPQLTRGALLKSVQNHGMLQMTLAQLHVSLYSMFSDIRVELSEVGVSSL